ncbi:MAG: amidohydrolase [Dehalococcoidia bacterium]
MSGDLVLHGGRIFTCDPERPWAEAVLVREGRIVLVGDEAEVEGAVGADARAIDLRGRLAVPGFCDAHVHLLELGVSRQVVNLRGARSLEEALSRVKARAERMPPGQWVRGHGWDQNEWAESAFPDRHSLDVIAPGNPVALAHTSGHATWVNSRALALAGITAETSDPAGGRIDRDAETGEPTGILYETAGRLVRDAMPELGEAQRREALGEAVRYAQSLGVTAAHDMGMGRRTLGALRELREEGELGLRVHVYLDRERLDEFIAEGLRTGDGDEVLSIGGAKFISDGALGSQTALMLEPLEGQPDNCGVAVIPAEELRELVRRALGAGLAPAVHAIGDRANWEVLDIYEQGPGAERTLRLRIEHCQLLHPQDVPRFAALGVVASMQPIHAISDMHKADRLWGSRSAGAYVFRSLLDSGARLAFGSDCPVETMDVIAGIHAAVTRRRAEGEPAGGWYPEQRLSVEEAVKGYTLGGAYAAGQEGLLGSISPGKLADLVVLSRDIFALTDPMEILTAQIDLTILGGQVVYEREG